MMMPLYRRSGDLLLPKGERATVWDPARRTHRGRIRPEPRCDSEGTVLGQTMVLTLKPTKTDPTGNCPPSETLCGISLSTCKRSDRREALRGVLPAGF